MIIMGANDMCRTLSLQPIPMIRFTRSIHIQSSFVLLYVSTLMFFTGIETMDIPVNHLKHGFRLWMQQFGAILIARFHHMRRNGRAFFSQIILPSFFIALAMVTSFVKPSVNLPSLKLTSDIFDKPNVILVQNNDNKTTTDKLSQQLLKLYAQQPSPDCKIFNSSFNPMRITSV